MNGVMACAVCGEPADEDNSNLCNNCDQRFHLRLRDDADGSDCGEVWINEQYMSLEFACFTCLGAGPASAGVEPPVGTGH
jgi:predicted amidophosphoribosyltransferase